MLYMFNDMLLLAHEVKVRLLAVGLVPLLSSPCSHP
jgi:hypothetical protein